ncbi:MAG: serine/threonine-protein kinase [Acidobacteriota bacterium]|nr:serine/threonine-protein kinase [Acidobacteriota bacterium]
MKQCKVCGKEWPEAMKHCPNDGTKLDQPDADSFLGKTIADKYHILSVIGEGSTGTVYKAERAVIGDLVAVKALRPELTPNPSSVERFKREAQAAGRIRHPNAISIYDFGMVDNIAYLVMELLSGRTLREVLKAERQLDIRRSAALMTQICGAVQRAHRSGVIHRDLKPENIMLEEFEGLGETVKVIDFSLAKLKITGNLLQTLTEEGKVAGTPYYMSPEQWLDKPLDPRSDVYSLGVMLFEILTGKVPFDADSIMRLAKKHVQQEPPDPRSFRQDLPEAVAMVILKSLSKKPEKRQQTALELARELKLAVGLQDSDEINRKLQLSIPNKPQTTGNVVINTRPPNCNVYLNHHYAGTTNDAGTITLQDIPTGWYHILVTRIGYKDWESKIQISGSVSLEAELELQPL